MPDQNPESVSDAPRTPDGSDAFALALDELLRAWSCGDEITRHDLLQRFPDLAEEVDDVIELAREIAVVRPRAMPQVPGYEVLGELGRGGMGIVYLARQRGIERTIALKVLPDTGTDERARARFLAEARGLGRIRHEHVVTIHEVIETSDLIAYAMEHVDGRSLASLLEELAGWQRRGPVPQVRFGGASSGRLPDPAVPWFCRLGIAVGRALGEVHRHGLVHRDVKPGNVLLRADGRGLLSDFGLVRAEALGLTHAGQVVGTPSFASPEQLRGESAIGPAADVFALGATLHCALTGRAPFAGQTPKQLLAAIDARRRQTLTSLGLPKDLETIVARCLEAEPRDRYESADAVADDLENLLAFRPVMARPLGPLARGARLVRRNRRLVAASAASALLVLAVAVAAGAWLWHEFGRDARFEKALEQARFQLLEATHAERVELDTMGRGPERPSGFERAPDEALAAYEEALAIDPRPDAALEREVVSLARGLVLKRPGTPTPTLRATAPATAAAALAWAEGTEPPSQPNAAEAADRRLLGLLAFLTARTRVCHEAWATLEMRDDPFVDAAAGVMHLQHGDAAKAYGRLGRALMRWPHKGFLAVDLADCAVRHGDLDVAEFWLYRADGLDGKDTFESHLRVRADLLAARGHDQEAADLYEQVIAAHVATKARVHYAPLLARTGRWQRLVEVQLDLAQRGVHLPDRDLAVDAWRWWRSLDVPARTLQIAGVLGWDLDHTCLDRVLRWCGGRQECFGVSGTAKGAELSPEGREAECGLTFLMEMTMQRETSTDWSQIRPDLRPSTSRVISLLGSAYLKGPGFLRRLVTLLPWSKAIPRILAAVAIVLPFPAAAQTVRWSTPTTPSGPSARRYYAMATDPVTKDVLLYGGFDGVTPLGDLWTWNGGAWAQVATTIGPPPLGQSRMVHVPATNTVLLFGGFSSLAPTASNATWIWNGAAWTTASSPAIPPARYAHALTYDATRNRVVMHGGLSPTIAILSDTWEFDPLNISWHNVTPLVPGPSVYDSGIAYDRQRQHVLLHGGWSNTAATTSSGQTWNWDGSTWTLMSNAISMSRAGHCMGWDDSRQRVALFGGFNNGTATSSTWEWDGATWLASVPVAGQPLGIGYAHMEFHPGAQHMVLFGGYNSTAQPILARTHTFTPDHPPRVDVTGSGCNPGASTTPELARVSGTGPWIGTTIDFDVHGMPPAPSLNVIAIDLVNRNLPLPGGCTLRAGLGLVSVLPLTPVPRYSFTIPNNPSLCGGRVFLQAAGIDLVAPPLGPGFVLAMSNGLSFTVGTR